MGYVAINNRNGHIKHGLETEDLAWKYVLSQSCNGYCGMCIEEWVVVTNEEYFGN